MNLVDYLTPNQQSIYGNFASPQQDFSQDQYIAPIGQALGGDVMGSGTGKLNSILKSYLTGMAMQAVGGLKGNGSGTIGKMDFTDKSRMTDGNTFDASNLV